MEGEVEKKKVSVRLTTFRAGEAILSKLSELLKLECMKKKRWKRNGIE